MFTESQNLIQVYVVGGSSLPFCLLQSLENHTFLGSCFKQVMSSFPEKNYTDCPPCIVPVGSSTATAALGYVYHSRTTSPAIALGNIKLGITDSF